MSDQQIMKEANMGSKNVTHKTMKIKSNTKGVPEVSTKFSARPTDTNPSRTQAGHMPHPKK